MSMIHKRASMMRCPSCQGKGKVTEDREQYDFVSRDPLTSRCHVCNGTGEVGPRKMLPNGRYTYEYYRDNPAAKSPVEASSGRVQAPKVDIGIDTSVPPATRLNVSPKSRRSSVEAASCSLSTSSTPSTSYSRRILSSGQAYLLVPESSSIFLEVYDHIRSAEMASGSWTPEDEELYILAYKSELNKLKEAIHG